MPASRIDLVERGAGALEQVLRHPLELGAGDRDVEVQRALGAGGDVGQVDVGRLRAGQLDLGLLGGLAEALHGQLVLGQVDRVGRVEGLDQVRHDLLVPVVTTEVVVTGGGLDLDDAVADLEQRHVERATTEVEDEDRLLGLALVQAVGQRGRGGLVDDAQDVEARDLTGLLGGLALRVLEVGGHGDDGVGDRLAQVGLGVPLELLQDARADLLRRVLLAVDLGGAPRRAHVPLDAADGAVDVGDGLVLGRLADEDLAVLGERDDRRGGARTLGVGDDRRLAALEDGHDGVGRAEVDSDRSSHRGALSLSSCAGVVLVRFIEGLSDYLREVRSTFLPSLTADREPCSPGGEEIAPPHPRAAVEAARWSREPPHGAALATTRRL